VLAIGGFWRRITGGTTCRPFATTLRVGWALACPEVAEGCSPSSSPSARFHRRAPNKLRALQLSFPGWREDVALTASARRALGRSMTDDGWVFRRSSATTAHDAQQRRVMGRRRARGGGRRWPGRIGCPLAALCIHPWLWVFTHSTAAAFGVLHRRLLRRSGLPPPGSRRLAAVSPKRPQQVASPTAAAAKHGPQTASARRALGRPMTDDGCVFRRSSATPAHDARRQRVVRRLESRFRHGPGNT
jgi:hypothetical protein